jgi:hypothetical protein
VIVAISGSGDLVGRIPAVGGLELLPDHGRIHAPGQSACRSRAVRSRCRDIVGERAGAIGVVPASIEELL